MALEVYSLPQQVDDQVPCPQIPAAALSDDDADGEGEGRSEHSDDHGSGFWDRFWSKTLWQGHRSKCASKRTRQQQYASRKQSSTSFDSGNSGTPSDKEDCRIATLILTGGRTSWTRYDGRIHHHPQRLSYWRLRSMILPIQRLKIGSRQVSNGFLRSLRQAHGLTHLSITGNSISNRQMSIIVHSISKGYWHDLADLNFSWNDLSGGSISMLAHALAKRRRPMDRLKLVGNPMGLAGLFAMISKPQHGIPLILKTRHVDLFHCRLQAQGASLLGQVMMDHVPHPNYDKSIALENLILDRNEIGDVGMRHLSSGLAQLCTLKVLSLYSNGMGNDGIRDLMNALASANNSPPSLEELVVCANDFDQTGVTFIAEHLPRLTNLKCLKLNYNACRDVGTIALASVLSHDKCTLEHLEVNFCHIQSAGAHALGIALHSNTRLKSLSLQGNPQIDRRAGARPCLEMLKTGANTTLTNLKIFLPCYDHHLYLQQLDFYLQWNRAGRRLVRSSSSSSSKGTSTRRRSIPDALWPLVLAKIHRSGHKPAEDDKVTWDAVPRRNRESHHAHVLSASLIFSFLREIPHLVRPQNA